MLANVTFYNDQELPTTDLIWAKPDGTSLYDFSSGWTFSLRLARVTAPATTLLLKTTGITGASTSPNLSIAWSTSDWSGLEASTNGTKYVGAVYARRTADSYDMAANISLTLKAAPGTSAVSPSSYPVTVDASTVTFTPSGSLVATNAQTAITEASTDLDAHINKTTGAHAASAISFTPTGTIASTDVQAAIAEVAVDAATTSVAGVVQLATNTEALARTSTTRAVTPANLATSAPFPGAYGTQKWVVVAGVSGGTAAAVDGKLCLVPFRAVVGRTIDRIGITISTAGAGSLVRLGLFPDDGNGYPDLAASPQDFGTVDSSTTGSKTIVISYTVTTPVVWLAAVSQGGTPPSWNSTAAGISWQWADTSAASFSASQAAYQKTGVTGALSALSAITIQSPGGAPMLYVRYA